MKHDLSRMIPDSITPDSEVAVVGLGRYGGGLGLTRHLLKLGHRVRLFDRLPESELSPYLEELDRWKKSLTCIFGEHHLKDFEDLQTCYLNPAVPWNGELAQQLRRKGKILSSDIECFLTTWDKPVVAITGSNGKSTCWEMLSRLLPGWAAGGNRGISVFDMEQENVAGCVLELSSFQLERIQRRFEVAIVTTFTPNHLDQHRSLEVYRKAKERVSRFQQPNDLTILGREVDGWPCPGKSLQLGKSFDVNNRGVDFSSSYFCEIDPWPLPGRHNRDLLALAIAAARHILTSDGILQHHVKDFCETGLTPLRYRQNIIAENPYLVVNDSKSTTPEATVCAINTFAKKQKTLHLICGGKEKGIGIQSIIQELIKHSYKLYVIGEQAARWSHCGVHFENVATLNNALSEIRRTIEHGDVILFSPGTSSFDQYRNYEERGAIFNESIRRILL